MEVNEDTVLAGGSTEKAPEAGDSAFGVLPCPWCGAVAHGEDEWGSLMTHKDKCYWKDIHGYTIGRGHAIRINNSEKPAWNTRAKSSTSALSGDNDQAQEECPCPHLHQNPDMPINRCLDCGEYLPSQASLPEEPAPKRRHAIEHDRDDIKVY